MKKNVFSGLRRKRAGGSAETLLRERIPFDPQKQTAVIRCSICTGEKVAGFKDLEGGHFTEVMLLKTPADEEKFLRAYGIEKAVKEY